MANWSKNVFKGFTVFMVAIISWRTFCVCMTNSSKKTAETIDFKLFTLISNRLLHKRVTDIFVKTSYSFYCNTLEVWKFGILEVHFERKQSKANIKYLKSKKNVGTLLLGSWLGVFQWRKILKNRNSVAARAHKVVSVLPKFDPHFSNIWRTQKR